MILWILGILSGLLVLYSLHYVMTNWTTYRINKDVNKRMK